MTNRPLVSIIIPSYNHAQFIGKAIESVLNQTHDNIELIVVDDGSRDNSHDIIRSYANNDSRIIAILNSENRGQSYVVNRALEIAKGEFVGLLPSDDWYLPRKTEAQLTKFLSSSETVGVVYAAANRYYSDRCVELPDKRPVHVGWIAEKLVREGNFVVPITPLFRRRVFDHVKPCEQFRAEGEAIYCRVALHYQFEYVDEVVAVMRDHTYNIGKNADVMYFELIKYWNWYFDLPEVPLSIKALRSQTLASVHRAKGMEFLGAKQYAKARQCFARAVRERKLSVLADGKMLAAFALTLIPMPLSDRIVDAYAVRRMTRNPN